MNKWVFYTRIAGALSLPERKDGLMEIIAVTKKEAATEYLAMMVEYWNRVVEKQGQKRKKKKQRGLGKKKSI